MVPRRKARDADQQQAPPSSPYYMDYADSQVAQEHIGAGDTGGMNVAQDILIATPGRLPRLSRKRMAATTRCPHSRPLFLRPRERASTQPTPATSPRRSSPTSARIQRRWISSTEEREMGGGGTRVLFSIFSSAHALASAFVCVCDRRFFARLSRPFRAQARTTRERGCPAAAIGGALLPSPFHISVELVCH